MIAEAIAAQQRWAYKKEEVFQATTKKMRKESMGEQYARAFSKIEGWARKRPRRWTEIAAAAGQFLDRNPAKSTVQRWASAHQVTIRYEQTNQVLPPAIASRIENILGYDLTGDREAALALAREYSGQEFDWLRLYRIILSRRQYRVKRIGVERNPSRETIISAELAARINQLETREEQLALAIRESGIEMTWERLYNILRSRRSWEKRKAEELSGKADAMQTRRGMMA